MIALDETKKYNIKNLSEKELLEVIEWLRKNDRGWKYVNIADLAGEKILYFDRGEWLTSLELEDSEVNAKELFYTLENIQVDCRELSKEQIKEMADVFEANGFKIWDNCTALNVSDVNYLLEFTGIKVFVTVGSEGKTTITYEKFMELFSNKEENFKKLVEVLNEELTEKAYNGTEYEVKYIAEKPKHYSKGIDTFARMEANCTKEECLAFAKGNIDKYNFRTKGQDLEDYKKIISYANWAIKLLKDEK